VAVLIFRSHHYDLFDLDNLNAFTKIDQDHRLTHYVGESKDDFLISR